MDERERKTERETERQRETDYLPFCLLISLLQSHQYLIMGLNLNANIEEVRTVTLSLGLWPLEASDELVNSVILM